MSIPTSYLTSTKNLESALTAIQGAKAPSRFTQAFLESLGFKSTSDRLLIAVLKMLGFLGPSAEPTERYFRFLDQSQAASVLAEAIEEAYADLFAVNTKANQLSQTEVRNKLKTLSQGQISDSVAEKMSSTFAALVKLGDFSKPQRVTEMGEPASVSSPTRSESTPSSLPMDERPGLSLGRLVYSIEIHLPESRDPAVYDALFQSLRKHLL